jgi:putative transcriptional regulator
MSNKPLFLLFAVALGWSASARAAGLSEPMILAAKPELRDNLYGASVLVVMPVGADQHMGFIVNRPTAVTLGKLFPDHAASQKRVDPIYLGGPIDSNMIFALVQEDENPGGSSLEVMPGLFLAFDGAVVDRIIESPASAARFIAGLVVWRAGELRSEVERGAWYVLHEDASLAMRSPDGLWEELVRRVQKPAHFLSVVAPTLR